MQYYIFIDFSFQNHAFLSKFQFMQKSWADILYIFHFLILKLIQEDAFLGLLEGGLGREFESMRGPGGKELLDDVITFDKQTSHPHVFIIHF